MQTPERLSQDKSLAHADTVGSPRCAIEKAGESLLGECKEYVDKGLKVPQKQLKQARLWLNDNWCMHLRPTDKGHVWSYDFVQDQTHEGKDFRMLSIFEEFTRECLAISVGRRLNPQIVVAELGKLFMRHGWITVYDRPRCKRCFSIIFIMRLLRQVSEA